MHDSAVDGFEPIAHIRQGTVHDCRKRVGQIAFFQRGFQINRFNIIVAIVWRNQAFSHVNGLSTHRFTGKQ
jgi:hypothetical protein